MVSSNAESREDLAEILRSLNSLAGVQTLSPGQAITTEYCLHVTADDIWLEDCRGKKPVVSRVDFVGGAKGHRRKFGGGKGQSIAKAVGLNKRASLAILDATAGMGGDAFVLACLGCHVTLLERSPIVRALLSDGLRRAQMHGAASDQALVEIISRMHLVAGDSLVLLAAGHLPQPDVVYLDPMFPERRKTAEAKKDMQFFHALVGRDEDANGLLAPALALARHRVVVKRPRVAPYLLGREPGFQLIGKANRFDVYPLKAFAETE